MSEHICMVCFRPAGEHASYGREHDNYMRGAPLCCFGCPCGETVGDPEADVQEAEEAMSATTVGELLIYHGFAKSMAAARRLMDDAKVYVAGNLVSSVTAPTSWASSVRLDERGPER